MFQIDSLSRQPVYEQLIQQLEQFILTGILQPGDQLPSGRSLSVSLSVNPNTIQKAFADLDAKGIIYSSPGIGCFVSQNAKELLADLKRRKLTDLKALAKELALAGVSLDELKGAVTNAYYERGVKK
jgi:GntR family transcriptional regulator